MNILVTGGAGFIGSHVCEELIKRGDSVICVDDFNDFYAPERKEKNIAELKKEISFKSYSADIRDFEALEKIFSENQINKVIHLAARAGVRQSIMNPKPYEDVNIQGTKNLLELSLKHKISNFIFGSSSSVYGESKNIPFSESDNSLEQISPYAKTKMAAEKLCKEFSEMGLNITCLRFFTVYGPRGRPDMASYNFTKLISEEKEIEVYGDGTAKRDFTYVSDIVAGILSALDKDFKFEIINLGNSNPIDVNKLISIIEQTVGKKAKIKHVGKQDGDVPLTYADVSKAEKLLGYRPKVKIEEGIKLLVEWSKEN